MNSGESLTFGSVLSRAATLMLRNIPLVVLVTTMMLLPGWLTYGMRAQVTNEQRLLVTYAWIPFSFLLRCLGHGAIIAFVVSHLDGNPVGTFQALGRSMKRLPALFWSSLCYYFWVYLGMICFLVPGIIWAFRQLLAETVTMLEGISGVAALRRSSQLVKVDQGLVAKVVFAHLFLLMMISLPNWVLLFQGSTKEQMGPGYVLWNSVTTFFYQIIPICLVLVYRNLRDRFEDQSESVQEIGVGLNPV